MNYRLVMALMMLVGTVCDADVIYNVTLNTAPLIGNSNAPFALDFQLTSGNSSSGVVNSATLSNFSFGAGGSAGTGHPFSNSGNASGTLSSTVSLNTSGGSFFNEFSQYFNPGSSLSFKLDLTNFAEPAGSFPDEFAFYLIDHTGGPVLTTDTTGNSLIFIDLTGSALHPNVFTTTSDGASITPAITAVPEPGTAPLAALMFLFSAAAGAQRFLFRKLHLP